MPITQAASIVSTISRIVFDNDAGTITVTFDQSVSGAPIGQQTITIPGAGMASLLATQATAGQSLGDEITAAIYRYTVANTDITGTVS